MPPDDDGDDGAPAVDLTTSLGPALPLTSPIIGTVAGHGPSGGGSPGAPPSAAPLLEVSRSVSAAVFTPPCTNKARRGHPRPRVAGFGGGVLAAEGYPNCGLAWHLDPTTIAKVGAAEGKFPYVVTIAVFEASASSTAGVLGMLERAMGADGVAAVVLDLNCSASMGGKARAVAHDFDAMEAVLAAAVAAVAAAAAAGYAKPLGVRLPPYFYDVELRRATRLLNLHLPRDKSSFVVVAGSVFGLVVDNETEMPLTKPCGGLGGVRGAAVAPMVLETVHSFRQALRSDVAVVASLACETGADVLAALLCGACAVQVDAPPPESSDESGLREHLARLEEELTDILDEKGYHNLGQVKKLKRFHPDGIAAAVAKRAQDKEEEDEVKKIETDALRNSQIQVEGLLLLLIFGVIIFIVMLVLEREGWIGDSPAWHKREEQRQGGGFYTPTGREWEEDGGVTKGVPGGRMHPTRGRGL